MFQLHKVLDVQRCYVTVLASKLCLNGFLYPIVLTVSVILFWKLLMNHLSQIFYNICLRNNFSYFMKYMSIYFMLAFKFQPFLFYFGIHCVFQLLNVFFLIRVHLS